MKWYFAHPINVYGTALEEAVLKLIQIVFSNDTVENPNQLKHQIGYTEYAQRPKASDVGHKGMNYFYDLVLPECGGCVALSFLDGRLGIGVAGEIRWFLEHNLPVQILVTHDKGENFVIEKITEEQKRQILSGDPKLVLSQEETRFRTWITYGVEPKRPYNEAHLISMPVPPGFYR